MALTANEELALAVIVEGFKKFQAQMGDMDGSIGKTGKKWTGLSTIAKKAGGVLAKAAKVGLAAVATSGVAAVAAVGGLGVSLAKMALEAGPVEGLAGAFEGLTASFVGGSDAMLEGLQAASGGMVANRDLMESFNKAASLVSKDFAQNLPGAMKYLGKVSAATGQDMGYLMDSLVTGVGRLSPMILDNLGIQVDLVAANEAYALSIGKSVKELTKEEQQAALMNQVLEKLAKTTADMPDIAGSAAQGMAGLAATLQNIKDDIGTQLLPIIQELASWFGKLASEYGPKLAEMVGGLAEFIMTHLPGAIDWASQAIDKLAALWAEHWPAIQAKLVEVWGFVEPILLKIGEWFTQEGPGALETLQEMWAKYWGLIKEEVAIVVEWFQANLPLIQEAGQTLIEFWQEHIVPALDNIWTIIKTIVTTAIKAVLGIIRTVMQIITGDWEGAWETIKQIVADVWEGIQTIVTEFIEGVANAVGTTTQEILDTWKENWEMAKTIVETAVEKIIEFIVDAAEDMKQAGIDMMEGLYKGIRETVKDIIRAVGGWIQDIIDEAKKKAGIMSPSTVFEGIGQDMMAGLVKGLADWAPAVRAQINAAVSPVMGSGGGSIRGGDTYNTYNYNLSTSSVTRPGGLAAEFESMAMATR